MARWFDVIEEDLRKTREASDPDAKATLVFLGTGASCGVPTYYCDCKACREAEADPAARRTCSSIAILRSGATLIDTSPDVHQQLQREGISDIERVLYTHEHFDHVGGLPQLEYYVRLRRRAPVDLYCNAETHAHIETHNAFMADTFALHQVSLGERMEHDGLFYTPVAAAHCPGTFGYLIGIPAIYSHTGKDRTVAYLPDTSRPCDETLAALRGVDLLILDATFTTGNWMPTQHLDVHDAMALADELEVGECWLTHLSMQFDEPMTTSELDALLEGSRTRAARDGLRLSL